MENDGLCIIDSIRTYQKTEDLNQNPIEIPSEPIRKQKIPTRILLKFHQNPSENRSYQPESYWNSIRTHQKTEDLNQNPIEIASEPIRKQKISTRILLNLHQSLSEKRTFARTLSEAFGDANFFQFTIAKRTPPPKKNKNKKNRGGLYYCSCNIIAPALNHYKKTR